MKTCRNCGVSNSADDRFCANCGAALPEQDDPQPHEQGEQTSPAQAANEAKPKADDSYGQPGYGAAQPPYGGYGQPPASDPYGNQPGGAYGQQPQEPYGQPNANPFGQQPDGQYGQPNPNPYGQPGQQPYGQPQYDQQGQPWGQNQGQYGSPQDPYGQSQGNPYGDQSAQPWYATGSTDAPPPATRGGRAGWKTALLIIVGVILLVCIGSIIFAVTPYGSDQVERLGTWAADESTRQAGGN